MWIYRPVKFFSKKKEEKKIPQLLTQFKKKEKNQNKIL